jgi:DNA primase
MSAIEQIKNQIDIVDIVSETVQLRRTGKNFIGFCPFHSNTRTPAFVVFPDTGTWRCFGQCNDGGDVFKFIMKREGWDFSEALQFLADRAGVELKPPSPEEQTAAEENDHLRNLLENAVIYYRHQLINSQRGATALKYLQEERGLSEETIEAFGLGYSPESWDATLQFLLSKGFSQDDLVLSGMVSERDSGGYYDRFRHRVMFPIRDLRGRMTGFGARILNPEDVPKFLNSPQTAVFDKGHLLYGLDRARKTIRANDQVVIVEGYLDVIAVHQAGFTNTVSPMGTALTEFQLSQLKRYSRRIVLALDPDAAGDKATLRGLEIARQTLDHEQDPIFDARGLLGHEARLNADIRVAALPDGLDPDEIVNRDPQEWEKIIGNARPIVIHVMETLAANLDLDDPKAKNEVAEQVLPLIADVPNPIERDAYHQRLARLLHVDERALLESSTIRTRRTNWRRKKDERESISTKKVVTTIKVSTSKLEEHCLAILLRYPDMVFNIDRKFREKNLTILSEKDFEQVDHQEFIRLILNANNQDIAEPREYIFSNLSYEMMDTADELLSKTSDLDPRKERVVEDLLRGLLDLRQRRLSQDIDYIRFLLDESENDQRDYKTISQYGQTMVQLTQQRKLLDHAIYECTGRSSYNEHK